MLNFLATSLISKKHDDLEIYADLENLSINGSTIPQDVLPTQQRPDLVILNRKEMTIYLIELTVSFETNFESAHLRKTQRYSQMKSDLEEKGYKVFLFPLEIGSRGHISNKNKITIMNTLLGNKLKIRYTEITKGCSKIALLCSYSIFHAYSEPSWKDPPYLEP